MRSSHPSVHRNPLITGSLLIQAASGSNIRAKKERGQRAALSGPSSQREVFGYSPVHYYVRHWLHVEESDPGTQFRAEAELLKHSK